MAKYKILVEYHPVTPKIMDVEFDRLPQDLEVWAWDHFEQVPIYAPAGAPTQPDKFDNHLNHKRKVQFESEMAFDVLRHYKLFIPTLHKLGKAMAAYLNDKLSDEQKSEAGELFRKKLYSDGGWFGAHGKTTPLNGREVYEEALRVLTQWKKIEEIFSTHTVALLIYRKILKLEGSPKYKELYHRVRQRHLFEGNRGREEFRLSSPMHNRPGIEEKPSIPYRVQAHQRAMDRMGRDFETVSEFAYNSYKKEIPFIAGPSGTAADCLMAIKLLCAQAQYNKEELKEYTFSVMGYLVSSGAHSIHEIYSVARGLGVSYDEGRYESIIPERFKYIEAYERLLHKYPDIIRAEPPVSSEKLSPVGIIQEDVISFSNLATPRNTLSDTTIQALLLDSSDDSEDRNNTDISPTNLDSELFTNPKPISDAPLAPPKQAEDSKVEFSPIKRKLTVLFDKMERPSNDGDDVSLKSSKRRLNFKGIKNDTN